MSRRQQFANQAPIELQVKSLSHDGRGVSQQNNKTIFVFGALPGETVDASLTRRHSRFDEATTIAVKTPSASRAEPPCAHFGLCGGCQMQHLEPKYQIQHKQALLAEQLTFQAKVEPKAWLEPLSGPFVGYRQKARLGVRYIEKKQIAAVGFREQKNNKLALIDSCAVVDSRVGNRITELRQLIEGLEGRNHIPQIEVATTATEAALVFRHMEPLSSHDLNALQKFCEQYEFTLYLQSGGVETVTRVWPAADTPFLSYQLADQNLRFNFHPLDFTQVNQTMNQKMINQALALLAPTKDDDVLDLFCGLGNFSLPMAQRARSVVGIEGSQEMVKRAQDNARLNRLENVEFAACDLDQDFSKMAFAQRSYNKMVLDPARSGAQLVVEQIQRFQTQQILYVSCNPATFVRDAAILVHQQGYQLEKVGVMDMFPHTAHVEVMGLFIEGYTR